MDVPFVHRDVAESWERTRRSTRLRHRDSRPRLLSKQIHAVKVTTAEDLNYAGNAWMSARRR